MRVRGGSEFGALRLWRRNQPAGKPGTPAEEAIADLADLAEKEKKKTWFEVIFVDEIDEAIADVVGGDKVTTVEGQLFWNRTWDYNDETVHHRFLSTL